MSEELTSCPKCEGLKPSATPVEILRAHESYLSYGFGYCGHLMDEHIAERMVRADREREARLAAKLEELRAVAQKLLVVWSQPTEDIYLSQFESVCADARRALEKVAEP